MLTSRMWRLWILSLVAYLPMGCSLADSSQGSLSHRDTQIQGALVQGPVLEFDGVCLATHRGSLSSALHLIDTARECMHMMEFVNYDDGSVSILLDQVIQAIVLADEESGHTDPALTRIAALGVQIRLDSHQVTTHNKPLMVDDHTLVGSHNLSGSALDQDIESAVWIREPQVKAYYEPHFQSILAESAPGSMLTWASSDQTIPLSSRGIPDGIHGCIQGGQGQVSVVLYAMTYNRYYPGLRPMAWVDDLVAIKVRGLDIQVALDGSDGSRNNTINALAMAVLFRGQVELKTTPHRQVTHAKVITCDDTLIIGDLNWASNSFSQFNGTSMQVTTLQTRAQFHT